MITMETIKEIIATYQKYGWLFRRLLGPAGSSTSLKEIGSDVPFDEFEIAAAWFSRQPKDGMIAWEIRYLGDPPFALLESLDEHDPDFSSKRQAVEMRLRDAVKGKLDKR